MLQDIVDAALRRKIGPQASRGPRSSRWVPYNLTIEDVRQEAWVAVLEAVEDGIHDPDELQRIAELRIKRLLQQSTRQAHREIPESGITEEMPEFDSDEPVEDDYSEDSYP